MMWISKQYFITNWKEVCFRMLISIVCLENRFLEHKMRRLLWMEQVLSWINRWMDQRSRSNSKDQIKRFKAHKMGQQIRKFNNHPPKETVETYPLQQNQSKNPKVKSYKTQNPNSSPKSPLLFNLSINPLQPCNL